MNVYLDIDGVLLTRNLSIPDYGSEFISHTVTHYSCYWLTTHCRNGQNKAVQYLSQFYPKSIMPLLEKIKPTTWSALKTEAINFTKDFVWLEDQPFESEKKVLSEKGRLNALIEVNLRNKNELKEMIKILSLKTIKSNNDVK